MVRKDLVSEGRQLGGGTRSRVRQEMVEASTGSMLERVHGVWVYYRAATHIHEIRRLHKTQCT